MKKRTELSTLSISGCHPKRFPRTSLIGFVHFTVKINDLLINFIDFWMSYETFSVVFYSKI